MATKRKPERSRQYRTPAFRQWLTRVSENLRRLRESRDWTQEQAADACEVDRRHYQAIEAGDVNLTVTTLARLTTGFGVDPLELLVPREPGTKRKPGRPRKPPA